MKGGSKNLKRAAEEAPFDLQQGQSIMHVVSHRGSNLIECIELNCIFEGNFVVVDESGREVAAESGRKVGCIVSQVLFYEQLRVLQKSSDAAEWSSDEDGVGVGSCSSGSSDWTLEWPLFLLELQLRLLQRHWHRQLEQRQQQLDSGVAGGDWSKAQDQDSGMMG
ncbi:hypothetical protein RJ639_041721 [Escallonia herrerae]|uniref:Uncharacterized protein n=1 Tax=Escallonia herrerae TaxID=1293975 RepID=A0AA88WU00_9ASTE|nr:hypothetical protein RJ639_041721 [Escallonia herrerae]